MIPPPIEPQRLFQSVPVAILALAPDAPHFTILDVTEAYLAATMTVREEIVGRSLFEVFPDNPADPAADGTANLRASLVRVIERREPDTMAVQKYDIRRPGRAEFEVRYWSPRNTPVFDDAGAVVCICHRVEDVTDLMRLQERDREHRETAEALSTEAGEMRLEIVRRAREIQAANLQLREMNDRLERTRELLQSELSSQTQDVEKLSLELVEQGRRLTESLGETQAAVRGRDEFLTIAAHELRTPLTPLMLTIETLKLALQRDGAHTPRIDERLLIMQRQVERLADLVEEVLEVSRITAGRVRLELEDLDLVNVAADAVAKLRHDAQGAGCAVVVEAPPTLPGRWDRARVRQILCNLLSNALKYSNGQPVVLSMQATDDHVVIRVRDQGIGIPREEVERIFERFERAVSARHYGGFGLGLFLTRSFVEAHGGSITVESDPGAGSQFTVTLPARVPSPPPAVATATASLG